MEKKKLREVPTKNYLILFLVLLFSGLLIYYFYMWYDRYEETKLNRRILDRYMEVVNYNELDNYLVENPDTILYVSVLQDEKIREFEKLVKEKYRDKLISQNLIYLDITELSSSEKNELVNTYRYNNLNAGDVPVVIVFDEGNVTSIYSAKANDYNIDSFLMYVNQINYGDDDLND